MIRDYLFAALVEYCNCEVLLLEQNTINAHVISQFSQLHVIEDGGPVAHSEISNDHFA